MGSGNVRVVEAVLTYFIVALVSTAGAALVGVDVTDTHTVYVALVMAIGGAGSATLKHFFPFLTTLTVKDGEE